MFVKDKRDKRKEIRDERWEMGSHGSDTMTRPNSRIEASHGSDTM